MAVTRNQSKGDSGSTPIMSPSPRIGYDRKTIRNRVDPTTNLTFGQIFALGILVSVVLQVSLAYLVMNDMVKLHGRATVQSLANFGGRLEYVLRYQSIHVFWLLITTILVIARRIGTGVVNPLEGLENIILAAKQVHTNSMEQYLLLFVNQLILVTNLAPDLFIKVIPLMNVLFFVARILFWLGYPKYRTAGFGAGITPIVIATFYNAYALINFLF